MRKADVVKAIERKESASIPVWYDYFADETKEKYGSRLDALLEKYPDDLTVCLLDEQDWGIQYRHAAGGVGKHATFHPLTDWKNYDEYMRRIPDPRDPSLLDQVKITRENNPDKYMMGGWWNLFFERFHYLRGMDNALTDLVLETDKTLTLLDRLEEYFFCLIERFSKEVGVDGMLFGDDFGMQDRMIISPDLFRDIYKPRMKRLVNLCHDFNMHVCLHSCGHITEIIEDLVDIDLDILHPLQPGTMDRNQIVSQYGSRISFFAGIDVQSVIIKGNEADIWQEVENIFKIFRRTGTGFMVTFANTVMPETPFENIEHLFKALAWFSQNRKQGSSYEY